MALGVENGHDVGGGGGRTKRRRMKTGNRESKRRSQFKDGGGVGGVRR